MSKLRCKIILEFSSGLKDAEGRSLQDVRVKHTVEYHASGAAEHKVTLDFQKDLDIGHVRIGTLDIVNTMDQ